MKLRSKLHDHDHPLHQTRHYIQIVWRMISIIHEIGIVERVRIEWKIGYNDVLVVVSVVNGRCSSQCNQYHKHNKHKNFEQIFHLLAEFCCARTGHLSFESILVELKMASLLRSIFCYRIYREAFITVRHWPSHAVCRRHPVILYRFLQQLSVLTFCGTRFCSTGDKCAEDKQF